MDKVLKYIPLLSLFSLIGAIIGGIYFFGGFMADLKSGTLTPEEKVRTLDHVNGAPTPAQLQRKYILDSLNTISAIKSRQRRDSGNAYNDSINRLNADQVYQIKEAVKKINRKLNIQ